MYSGPKVSLTQLLNSRDERAQKQREWAKVHSLPLISFTINMVGPVKRNHIAQQAFRQGIVMIDTLCLEHSLTPVQRELVEENSGYEMLLCVEGATAQQLKALMVDIENRHPLGRLFDIDVLDGDGKLISRDDQNLPRRKCLVCGNEAKVCARTRAHQLDDLIAKMSEMINDSQ